MTQDPNETVFEVVVNDANLVTLSFKASGGPDVLLTLQPEEVGRLIAEEASFTSGPAPLGTQT